MEEMIALVANVGFPIVITSYLLIRMEGKIDKLTNAINNLAHNLNSNKNSKVS